MTYGEQNSYGQNNYSSYNTFSQNTPAYTQKFSDNYTSTPVHYVSTNRNYNSTLHNQNYDGSFGNVGGYENQTKKIGSYYEPSDYYSKSDSKQYSDGYSSSEYLTSTQKTPDGLKKNTFKYESYHSSPLPTYSSSSEKYYTSIPAAISPLEKKTFETFKNDGDTHYQSSFSSNVEYINEPPTIKDNDTLEQKMLKKSVTQQIFEKKTVSVTKSTKQESATKTFRFD